MTQKQGITMEWQLITAIKCFSTLVPGGNTIKNYGHTNITTLDF
jgi:hypothetical protein